VAPQALQRTAFAMLKKLNCFETHFNWKIQNSFCKYPVRNNASELRSELHQIEICSSENWEIVLILNELLNLRQVYCIHKNLVQKT
jgi:hypothetical protein